MTYDIALPLKQKPRYPDRCVACEKEHPETTAEIVVLVSVRTRSISSEFAETVVFGTSNSSQNRHVRLHPPACETCSRSINRQSWYALILQYAYPLLGVVCCLVAITYGYLWIGMPLLFAGIAWTAIRSVVWPQAICVTAIGPNLVYEFRSAIFSTEFKELNCVKSESETPTSLGR